MERLWKIKEPHSPVLSKKAEEKIRALINIANTASADPRSRALYELWLLSNQDDLKQPMCHPSFNLLPTVKNILETDPTIEIRTRATGILWLLSRDDACIIDLINPELNLLPLIMNLLKSTDEDFDYRIHLITVINNMCLVKNTHSLLLAPELEWLPYWKRMILLEPEYYQWYRAMANFTQTGESSNVQSIIQYNFHRIIVKKLIKYSVDPDLWGDERLGGIPYWCITFVANLSGLPVGETAIRELNELEFFLQLMKSESLEGVRAMIVVANIYGRDEDNPHTKAILRDHQPLLSLFLDVLENTIRYNEDSVLAKSLQEKGFNYGTFKLRTMVSALKNLSISDENKQIMVQYPRIIQLAMQIVRDYVNDEAEYSAYVSYATERAGGGGKDLESLEYVLELLLQLSFVYDDETEQSDLQKLFQVKGINPIRWLEHLASLPAKRQLPNKLRRYATTLLDRLKPKPSKKYSIFYL